MHNQNNLILDQEKKCLEKVFRRRLTQYDAVSNCTVRYNVLVVRSALRSVLLQLKGEPILLFSYYIFNCYSNKWMELIINKQALLNRISFPRQNSKHQTPGDSPKGAADKAVGQNKGKRFRLIYIPNIIHLQ
jgi:hypothetical protein